MPDALDQAAILVARVLAVHHVENAVGAGLHRQVQVGHHRRQIAVSCDQRVVHVARMAGGVAQARDAGHVRQAMKQASERPDRAVRPLTVIGVHVLPDQRQLAHARIGEAQGLVEDFCDRARDLRAAGIGHDAEGAELVAALLDREEGRHAAALGLGLRRCGQVIELVLDGEFRVDDAIGARLLQERRQVVIVLRPDHHVDGGRPTQDLLALRLRDAAGDDDLRLPAMGLAFLLQLAHATELGINLFGGLLADMAGVEDDEVRLLHRLGFAVAFGRQHVRHALGIVDVHLAAIGFDENFFHEVGLSLLAIGRSEMERPFKPFMRARE